MLPVRWYCPPGIDKPKHAVIPGECRMFPGMGVAGAPPDGICYGGAVEDGEEGWHRHPGGHWFNMRDAAPALLIRLETNPRLIKWNEIEGAKPEHIWRVPALLDPVYDKDGSTILMFKSALDRLWTGNGWDTPADVSDIQRRLLSVCHALGTDRTSLGSDDAVRVAIDILRLGHEFDAYEVTKAGWISEVLTVRVLIAACGMELT